MHRSNGIVGTLMTKRTLSVNNILKKIWITIAILIIFAAVFSSIFRSLTPWAKQYKGEVEQHLSVLIGQPVTIQTMETGWYWLQPVIKLKDVTIADGQKTPLHLEKLLIGINVLKSLWHWRIQPGVLYIEDIDLVIRQKEGRWNIDGISMNAIDGSEMTPERSLEVISWLAHQERLIIRHVSAHLHFSDGGLMPISGLNVSIENSGGHYKIKGAARLDQTNSTSFQLLADLYFNPYHFEETEGHVYFAAKRVVAAQWQSIFPKASQHFEGGKGDIALWLDLKHGAVSLVQSKVNFKRLAWRFLTKNSQIIQSFSANLAWKPDDKGWQFDADHIHLRMGGTNWPENQVLVKFNKEPQSYRLFVKSILIESLLSETVDWPQALEKLIQINPHGVLSDTQVTFKEMQLESLLTRFDKLGWSAKDSIPQVENLTGVLNWQAEEGRLELDSENATIAVAGYPAQNIAILNGAFDWKELSDGLRVSIERFVLSQPELTLSAEGAIDQVTKESIGNIRLGAQFSIKNIQKWIPYLPQKHLKPKLYAWLQNDIKKIADINGQLNINGLAKDFPFDDNNGDFSIVAHAIGGELTITSKWQLIKDLEGYIRLKKRNLEIDLVNGDFQGAPVKQMNLRIDNIGKNKEVLLIHGIINASLKKMMNFVMASPLKEKLSTLNMLSMKGLALLNLQVQADLYPESDDVLVKGDLTFKNNTAIVTHHVGAVTLEDLTGDLSFDEKGISQSALTASAFGYPLDIKIQSVKTDKPYTNVFIKAECTLESIKSRFNLPILSFLKGMFALEAKFKLTEDPNDLDNLSLVTDLRGLAINLPAPLGKTHNDSAPLEVNVDFNPKKAIRLKANYDKRLSTDFTFQENKGIFDLKSGQIKLGNAYAVDQNQPGLAVVGTLNDFDIKEWSKVFTVLSSGQTDSYLLKKLRIIHLTLNQFTFFKQKFDKLNLSAKILPNKDWAFNIKHKNIAGDLTYHPATHGLSGFINQLHLDSQEKTPRESAEAALHYQPKQIPNLNVRINNFSYGDIEVGDITLKSQSSSDRWLIDYCKITSPIYEFDVQGEWTQRESKDETKLHVNLHLKDLAQSLERWHITPAVDAGKGDMEFKGGWSDSVFNFSLASLNGAMYLKLKNGIITDLSPETEEKLGLGKLLSILSLQTIPRRLKLDFSDLSHDGYSFDVFKGNFNINKGIMSTTDGYIDGPVAYASMKGSLDLVRRLYDVNLSISPHITASLPIVATIAGGPIAGLAAWVANKIINKSMQKISAYSYKITGPWKEPVVHQLSIVKKLIKNG